MEEWVRFLLGVSARATVVLLAAYASSVLLRRASSAARHAVWAAALVAVLALPALRLWLPPLPAAAPVREAAAAVVSAAPATLAPPAAPRTPQWPVWALAAWAAGVCAVVVRLAAGVLQVHTIARRATPVDAPSFAGELGLRRPVALRQSPHIGMPLAWGIVRPMVLLPRGAGEWPAERLRAVLLHELAHVQRHDCLLQVLSQLACALYWFHPLAWLAAARLRREREQACDDRVLSLGTRPPDYAQHLLELARTFAGSRQRSLAVAAMARPSGLRERLAAILDPKRDRRAVTRRGVALAALAVIAVLLPLAASTAAPQQSGASVAGIVSDPSGARVPGALVLATFPGTDRKEAATAGPVGDYRLQGLPEGRCTVEICQPGFAPFSRDLVLRANSAERLDVTLALGRVNETVDVVGKRTAPPPRSGPPQRIRVGGNVQATRLVYSVKPEYPEDAKTRGIEGTVLLQAVISKEGEPLSITPLNTGVDVELTKAALDAVRQWRYEPTRLNGQPVEVVTTITVNFRLAQ